jgi:hypothetical protein
MHFFQKLECLQLEDDHRSAVADLKLASKRLDILQTAFLADCQQQPNNNNGNGSSSFGGELEMRDMNFMEFY